MMPVGGGHPLLDDGRLVGGVGISGGNAEQDQQAVEPAMEKVGFPLAA